MARFLQYLPFPHCLPWHISCNICLPQPSCYGPNAPHLWHTPCNNYSPQPFYFGTLLAISTTFCIICIGTLFAITIFPLRQQRVTIFVIDSTFLSHPLFQKTPSLAKFSQFYADAIKYYSVKKLFLPHKHFFSRLTGEKRPATESLFIKFCHLTQMTQSFSPNDTIIQTKPSNPDPRPRSLCCGCCF